MERARRQASSASGAGLNTIGSSTQCAFCWQWTVRLHRRTRDEVATRPWPTSSMARVISVARTYVPPATEFVPAALTPQEIWQQHEKDAQQIADTAAEREAVRAIG